MPEYVDTNTGEHVTTQNAEPNYYSVDPSWVTVAEWQAFLDTQAEAVKQALIADPDYLGGAPGLSPSEQHLNQARAALGLPPTGAGTLV